MHIQMLSFPLLLLVPFNISIIYLLLLLDERKLQSHILTPKLQQSLKTKSVSKIQIFKNAVKSDKKANFSFLLLAPYFWSKYYQPALLFPIFVLTLHTTRGPKNGSHSNCKGPNSRDINSHFVIQTIQPSLLLQLCYFMQKYSIR